MIDDEFEVDEQAEEQDAREVMSDDELLKAVRIEVDRATTGQDERQSIRSTAAGYFYGKLPGPPTDADGTVLEGSTIVSTDVADAVEGVLAEIMPAFSGQSPVEFVPFGPEDEAQSDIETRAVTHVAMSSGAYMALNGAVKDALLRRAGVVKVWWEETTDVEYQTAEGIDPMMLPNLLQEQEGERIEIDSADIDETTGMVNGTIRRYRTKASPRIEAVPLDEYLIDGNVSVPVADEARFQAHRRPMRRTELVKLGFDRELVYQLSKLTTLTEEQTASRARASSDTEFEVGHVSNEFVMVVEAYYQIDRDGDGIAELRRIITAGGADGTDELLLDEPWKTQPFCVGVPYLGLYSWDGISLFDKLKGVQDTKTDLLRSIVDATRRSIRQRIGAVERQVNMDDLQTSELGGIVRMKVAGAVVPLPEVQLPPAAFTTLQYMDDVRKDKGGGAIDTAAQVNALAGDTAHGLERMMSAAEQVNAMVAKNLCETMMKPLYKKLHGLLRDYWQGGVNMRANGMWQQAVPSTWQPRDELVVSMGMSVGERTRRTAALQAVIQYQMQALQTGQDGVLVSLPNLHAALLDLSRMGGLPAPEQYWTDPSSQEAQAAAQQKAQAAQQQAQLQQQAAQAQMQVPIEMERIRAEAKRDTQAMQNELGMMKAMLDQALGFFAQRVKLADVETKTSQQEAQREIDKLQATTQGPAGPANPTRGMPPGRMMQ
jgi:hypothetical protein